MKIKLSPVTIGLLQTTGLVIYTAIIGWIMINGSCWFGPKPNFLGPTLFLALLCFSAIYCAAVMFGYPFYVFWEKKNFNLAAKIVVASSVWLLVFIVIAILFLTIFR